MAISGWQVTWPVVNSSSLPCVVRCDDVVFGWQNVTTASDARQEAWRIEMVARDFTFDSGWIYGPEDHFVRVPGLQVEPGRCYRWRVTTRSSFRRTGMSQDAYFFTLPEPWTATWIRHPDPEANNPQLRTAVTLDRKPVEAVWFVAGVGVCHPSIDAHPVTAAILEPGRTHYDRRMLVTGYDVTEFLTPGDHRLELDLGRGFYDMATPTIWGWHEASWRHPCRATAELHLRFDDGTTRVIETDENWQASHGPVRSDSMFEGETYDADWRPQWVGATVDIDTPMAPLAPQTGDPIHVAETLTGVWDGTVVDFGQIIAGTGEFRLARGAKDARFTARYGERRTPAGGVESYNDDVLTDRFATDEVHLTQRHPSWTPRHSYQGFRYIEIEGLDDPSTTVEVMANRIGAAVRPNCTFWSSDPDLNRLHRAAMATIRNSLIDVPIDSPRFDKNGWTGDAQLFCHVAMTGFDVSRFLSAWLDDMADAQRPTGQLPVIVPTPGFGYNPPDQAPAPEWTSAYPYLLTELVAEYGDLRLLADHYDRALRYLDYELGRRDADGLIDSVMGDYLPPGVHGPAPEDHRLTATLFVARALRSIASNSLIAGRWDNARLFRAAEELINAVNEYFLDIRAGYYRSPRDDGFRQTHQVAALATGVVPTRMRPRVEQALIADIEARGRHHNCGHIGVRYLPGVLTDAGRSDLALAVLRASEPPGWLPWLNQGNRTFAEGWTDVRAGSHPLMAGAIGWLYDRLVGLRNEGRAWSRFTVSPDLTTDVDAVRLRRGSVHGVISVAWDKPANILNLHVPVGSKAAVRLQGRRYDVGAGHWTFPLVE